jgi:SAM-dependent methyltransferase
VQQDFPCPVCDARHWHSRPQIEFRRSDEPRARSQYRRDYVRLRRELLFEVWFPGAQAASLTPQFCERCGFMCYSPRPTAADLEAKYQYLALRERTGAAMSNDERERKFDRERADRAFRLLSRRIGRPTAVLDVGGGDGRLLEPFLENGVDCSILDWNPTPRPGIHYLGRGLEDLPANQCFDAVLCHHVLEHVAEPVSFLRSIFAHVARGGLVYVEVPLEIWRGIPIRDDPVTHVNYFTRSSLCNAIERAGGRVLQSRSMGGTYGNWRLPVAWVVAAPGDGSRRARLRSGAPTRRLLDASWSARLWHRFVLQPQLDDAWHERRRSVEQRVRRLINGPKR